MSAPSYIRRHINNFVGAEPFSIRDFLIYGPRNTVDQVFHRLIKSGRIIRVARGIFIKSDSPLPSALEVAQVKAAAFGRTIVRHGSQVSQALFESTERRWLCESNTKSEDILIFACSGSTSSFRVGKRVVQFVRTSARKMQLGDSQVGLAIRALWYLGKETCTAKAAALVTAQFGRKERRLLRISAASMPAWLRQCLACVARMDCLRNDLEPNLSG